MVTRSGTRNFTRVLVASAATAAVLLAGVPRPALAGNTSGASCSTTTMTASPPNAPGPWLDITATGLAPLKWYSVFAVMPSGWTEGVAVYANASGVLHTTSLSATEAGTYSIAVDRFHTNATITSCSLTAG